MSMLPPLPKKLRPLYERAYALREDPKAKASFFVGKNDEGEPYEVARLYTRWTDTSNGARVRAALFNWHVHEYSDPEHGIRLTQIHYGTATGGGCDLVAMALSGGHVGRFRLVDDHRASPADGTMSSDLRACPFHKYGLLYLRG